MCPAARRIPLHLWNARGRGGCDMMCARYVEYVLEKEGDIAAVIPAEPRSGAPPTSRSPNTGRSSARPATATGRSLIFDEIPQRPGPDRPVGHVHLREFRRRPRHALVIGKGLGGGVFPPAALIAREGLDVAGNRALGHYTHEKSPVGLPSAALADDPATWRRTYLAEHARELGRHTL